MKNGMFKKILSITIVVLMLLTAVFATGCGKKDKNKDKDKISIEDIEKKAKDTGFEIEKIKSALEDGMVVYIEISDPNSTGLIPAEAEVVEFEDADTAKEYYEKAKESVEALEALGLDGTYDAKRSGKIVIAGHVDIIKKVW